MFEFLLFYFPVFAYVVLTIALFIQQQKSVSFPLTLHYLIFANYNNKYPEKLQNTFIKNSILIFLSATNFSEEEYLIIKKVFLKAGKGIFITSDSYTVCSGNNGLKVKADTDFYNVNEKNLAAVVLVGGKGSKDYWDNLNNAIFPPDFEPTLDWNRRFARQALEFCQRTDSNIYFMPIRIDLVEYLKGII